MGGAGEPPRSPEMLRRSSSMTAGLRVARSTSVTFVGGAAVLPAAEDASETPLGQPLRRMSTMRRLMHEQREARVQEMIATSLGRFCCVLAAFSIVVAALFVNALAAWISCRGLPCDQEMLQYYMPVTLAWGSLAPRVSRTLSRGVRGAVGGDPGVRAQVCVLVGTSLPGWGIIGWGFQMLGSARTCPATNPGLYYPMKWYIAAQALMALVMVVFATVSLVWARRIMLILSRFVSGPSSSCQAAVSELPKVAPDAPELVDAEDGEVMSCSICLMSLSESGAAVRCPCGHFFHESCLMTWCKAHKDCPLCRQQIGATDAERGSRRESV